MSIHDKHVIPRWYYYSTPLFILLDYLGGINVRVSALDSLPLYKNAYYGLCIVCALSIYIFPKYSAVVALLESTINFMMVILLLLLPYVQFAMQEDILSTDWGSGSGLSVTRIVNLLVAGSIAALAIQTSSRKLSASSTQTEPASPHSPNPDSD
jgi:hypothetical protein